MRNTIFDSLNDYRGSISFHTPGHKGRIPFELALDLTEIDFSNAFPSTLVVDAEKNAARAFGSEFCRFLVGGSSMGIKAAVLAVNGDIIAAQNSHQSVFEAAELARVRVFEIPNEMQNGLAMPLTKKQLENEIKRRPSAKAVVITSPDYYGLCADAEAFSCVKESGLILIADSAHGAHFPFCSRLKKSAASVADFAVFSGHKTLPVLTQASYMTVNGVLNAQNADNTLKLVGTTSPSYLLCASLEYGINYAIENAQHYEILYSEISKLNDEFPLLKNHDFTRVALDCDKLKIAPSDVFKELCKRRIFAELYNDRYVLFIVSICNTPQDITALRNTLREIIFG